MNFNTPFVALALGSNLGDRQAALKAALAGLAPFARVIKASPVYETAAAYVTDQPAFLNMAVLVETKLLPMELLVVLKKLEVDLGRTPTFRYGPRVLDIDILFYDDVVLDVPEFVLPHPRLHERAFVLQPLADIAPDWVHPVLGQTVRKMLEGLPATSSKCLGELPL